MSIIQNIRDKYARISVIAIALALVGFILTDYFSGRGGNLFGGNGSNTLGSVNGKKIDFETFAKKVEQMEDNYKQQGYPINAATTQTIVEQIWNQEVSRVLFQSEFDKLGMRISKKEKGDILYGPNAPDVIKKAGTDENGIYDPIRAKQQVDQMFKNKQVPQSQKDDFNRYITELEEQRMGEKYIALFTNSTNYPKWFVEKQMADNNLIAKISMVKLLYTDSSFVDSSIAISDKAIEDYISSHKNNFKQAESRSINYVSFSAAPTATDSTAALKLVADLKPEFDTTQDVEGFLLRNNISGASDDYVSASKLPAVAKDNIIKLSINGVYGPYLNGASYVLTKLTDTKQLPDSVKARHILIQTFDPRQNQQLLEDSVAKKRIDSIEAVIKGGARFDSLAIKLSDDKGSGAKGGLLSSPSNPGTDYFTQGEMVKEFNKFCFQGKKGEKKVVKTEFGYHYIEILDQKNFGTHYKIDNLSKEVIASKETDDAAQEKANIFFGDSRDLKSFDATFEKTIKPQKGVKGIAANISRMDAQVNGIGVSRPFVKSVYDAKRGEVLKPERIGNDYVVAVVTEVIEEGLLSVEKARSQVEPLLRNRKKAETIKQKLGKITTLEAAAAAVNKPVEIIDSIRMDNGSRNLGYEPKVRGAAFNTANKGKVVTEPIEGVSGVYVIRVENISATASTEGSVADQRKSRYESGKQSGGNPVEALKNAASIKDKRSDRY